MKDFTSFDTWDIAETVQSQYATSKRMRAVIDLLAGDKSEERH